MNGKLYADVNGTMNASSQESAYKLARAVTSGATAVNKHSDSSNLDDNSNLGEDSGGDESGSGERVDGQPDISNQPEPNIQEQIGSNSECADSSDKQSVKRNAQGVPFCTMNEDSIDLVVMATTIRYRENNNTGGSSPLGVFQNFIIQKPGLESGGKLSNAKASDTVGGVVDIEDISNSNNLNNAIGARLPVSRSHKRGHGDPQISDLPLKRVKVLADCQNDQVLGGIVDAVSDNMEVDSCDSMNSNGPVAAGVQGVTSQNNCTNSESESGGSINGDGDSCSEESQHVHDIQSDSEDDQIQKVSKPGTAESDDLDSAEDSSSEEDESTDGSDGEIQNDEHVSINSDTVPEGIDDDSSKDINSREAGEVLLVDDTSNHGDDKTNQRNKMKLDDDIYEVSDNDDIPDGIPAKARAVIDIYPRMSHKLMDVTKKLMTHNQELAEMKGNSKNAINVNDTKDLVGLSKSKASDKEAGEKKGPTKGIFDTNSSVAGKSARTMQEPKRTNQVLPIDTSTTSSYHSITARSTKNSTITVSTSTNSTPILSSLTDGMFVVEAPSFIVPYVYEKPSVKPLREFVDIMGKELDDKRLKEEKEKLEKEKLILEVKKDKTNEVPIPNPVVTEAVVQESPKKKKCDKKAKKWNDDGDVSWNGTSSLESDDDLISEDSTHKTIKEKEDDLDGIKDPTSIIDLTSEIKNTKSDNYFDNSLGKFFINIGVNLVQEYVQVDLLKQQKRKLYKEKRSGNRNITGTELAIKSLTKNLEVSQDNNATYKFQQKKCVFCCFKSESVLAMAHHLETPHMKNNIYKCNFCVFEIRSPHDILYHVEAEHKMRGRLERAPAYHQCANCPFEDNGKSKLARHLLACAKKFKPAYNLSPPVEWDPPAKLMIRAHPNAVNMYQTVFPKTVPMPVVKLAALYRGRGQPTVPLPTVVNSFIPGAPPVRGGLIYRPNQTHLLPTNFQLLPGGQTSIKANPLGTAQCGTKTLQHQQSISITPLPRAPMRTPSLLAQPTKPTFVICEICDGYIKDLDQLRNHMQWIHQVKIHPKMIHSRPPLNCQKCQFRFFTDQGLERHLLGSHGLVTSSMQELANRGKDAGRCPACGRVYQWKLLNHVAREHNVTLKPAHLSYKCTVCAATFGMYKQFENHVYSAHSVAAKPASLI